MATFTGSNSAEVLPDLIIGPVQAIGNDFVDALGGDDVAIGWSGDDVIRGGAGADVIIGGLLNAAGIITLSGIDAADYTTSVDGVTIDLSVLVSLTLPILGINIQLAGASQGFGGDAQGDYLVGIVNLIGSNTGADNLSGSAAANTLNGQGGDDTLDGQGGNDILLGGAGDDTLVGGGGADSLQGGAGTNDTADYSGSASAVTVDLVTGTGSGGDAQGDTLTGVENLIGSAGNDTLIGSAGDNTLTGGAGADALTGNGGVDTADYSGSGAGVTVDLIAGTGTGGDAQGDTLASIENLTGSAFRDVLHGSAGANALSGGAGNDMLYGGAGADTINGGDGIDTAGYFDSDAAVTVDLAAGTGTGGHAQGDVLSNIERLGGSTFDDTLSGNAGANAINGGGGNDIVAGAGGNDQLYGGNGNDQIDGGDGWDTLEGEAGDDQLSGGAFGDILRGGGGADHLTGGDGWDTASYWSNAVGVSINLETNVNTGGDAQGDTIDNDVEYINGSSHDDVMVGNALSNGLIGFDGVDTLSGGGGNDTLRGGNGADVLNGGSGSDYFSYTAVSDSTASATDTIQDFQHIDAISLRSIDADGNSANGDTAFSFIGTTAFSGAAGQLRYETSGGNTIVSADVNGDGAADMVINLTGVFTLQGSDFLL
ncbi:beta strand repeat-containing protein [Inquilinus sp. OTU3971]|uniref:beta strand repeat-containing protein n=1 Tax=Inquilinus sp. OTU3971 TaxID=3043855 RepID=UPI00313D11EA